MLLCGKQWRLRPTYTPATVLFLGIRATKDVFVQICSPSAKEHSKNITFTIKDYLKTGRKKNLVSK